jgi:hypothetical protein
VFEGKERKGKEKKKEYAGQSRGGKTNIYAPTIPPPPT